MKINIRAIAAVVIAVIVGYLVFDGVAQRTLQGSQLSFSINTGRVELANPTDEPMQARISSSRTFTVTRSDGEEAITGARQGSGRTLSYVFEGELPPGTLDLSVTRGSDVEFTITAPGAVRAVVSPRSAGDTQSLLLAGVVIVLGLLGFAAYSSRETWLPLVQRKVGGKGAAEMSERVIQP